MSLLSAIILGVVQGLTEFLPVSSSGHLSVFQHFLGLAEGNLSFDVAVHFGTVLSVLTVYHRVVRQVLRDVLSGLIERKLNDGLQLFLLILIGSVPAGLVGILFKDQLEQLFLNLWVVSVGFFITGALLFFSRAKGGPGMSGGFSELEGPIPLTWWQALVIGVSQAFAIVPGVSRSGSTIAVGLLSGVDRKTAALFSFMLAIVAILGAALLQLLELREFGGPQILTMGVGIVVSYTVGVLGLKLVLGFVKQGRMHYFSYYLWVLGAALMVYQLKGL